MAEVHFETTAKTGISDAAVRYAKRHTAGYTDDDDKEEGRKTAIMDAKKDTQAKQETRIELQVNLGFISSSITEGDLVKAGEKLKIVNEAYKQLVEMELADDDEEEEDNTNKM